jgi:hypothetical protein
MFRKLEKINVGFEKQDPDPKPTESRDPDPKKIILDPKKISLDPFRLSPYYTFPFL